MTSVRLSMGASREWTPNQLPPPGPPHVRVDLLQRRPLRLSRAADNGTATSLKTLAAEVFADADGRLAGNQRLRWRSAVLGQAANRKIRGTYLLINIAAFSGDLPDYARINPGGLFG